VAARRGVLGCILCDHYISSGLPGGPNTLDGSVQKLTRHIDKIHELTGTYDNIGIGSDLDGYIKPALAGLEHMGRMAELQERLADRYGQADAEKICSGNALRVLLAEWGNKRPAGP
jgi:microsomal dipeptidase-like Zn-dependent dipeptidase